MKTSMKWLKNYVDLTAAPEELAEALTLAGLEVEGIETVGSVPDGVVVAEVLSRRQHPNADKLSVCEVTTGTGDPLQIVCGAPNCDAGKRVPLATIGTEFDGGFKIKKTKLRGELSQGMMCSEVELGLGQDKSGLMELPADTPLGTPLNELYQADTVIDWEVTPNRPDWLSHVGIAREAAAVYDCRDSFRLPPAEVTEVADAKATDMASVEVRDPDLCPRYTARVIRNVKIGPSPDWMQEALTAVGMRPINNVVDITNYVLMECGQPLHAFDYELLAGGKIIVRRAAEGEKMMTLDDEEHTLSSDNLLIADAERGVALAGVMGGANSEIRDETTTVLLESAAFAPSNIRATAKKLGIGTESSHRFERGVDIEMVDHAGQRAAALICELAGGELLSGVIDVYAKPYKPAEVSARFNRINQLLGVDVTPDQAASYFERLGVGVVTRDDATITVSVPPYRLDLEREADLIEEVVRLYGLANIPANPAVAVVGGPMASDTYYPTERVRGEMLALGLDEAITYSLIGDRPATFCTGVAEEETVKLSNPLSAEAGCFRPSVVPSLMQTVAHNIAHNNVDITVFELARVAVHAQDLPEERHQVGIAMTGRPHSERFGAERDTEHDFYDMKGLIETWLDARGILQALECRAIESETFKPGRAAAFCSGDTPVVSFGEAVDGLTSDIRLKHPLFLAVIELEEALAITPSEKVYTTLPQFPAVTRDISLVAESALSSQAIVEVICSTQCPWLEDVRVFDIYEDEKAVGAGKKSLAYTLTYRDAEKTLTDKQVNKAHEKIRNALAQALPVELR